MELIMSKRMLLDVLTKASLVNSIVKFRVKDGEALLRQTNTNKTTFLQMRFAVATNEEGELAFDVGGGNELVKLVALMSDTVTIVAGKNQIEFKGGNVDTVVPLLSMKDIVAPKVVSYEYPVVLRTTDNHIKRVINVTNIHKSSALTFKFDVNSGVLRSVAGEGRNRTNVTVPADVIKGEEDAVVQIPYEKWISTMKGEIEVHLKTDYPVKFKEGDIDHNGYEAIWVIAPYVEQ